MRLHLIGLSLISTLMLLFGCSSVPQQEKAASSSNEADWAAVRKANQARNAALEAGDVEAYLDSYTDDAIWLPPHTEEITGKSTARQRLTDKLKNYSYSFSTESKEENQVGPGWIIDWGTYVSAVTDNKTGDVVNDVGSYLSVWKKCEDGKWRIAYDIWNSDRPAPAPVKK